jgi:hypothetical protein
VHIEEADLADRCLAFADHDRAGYSGDGRSACLKGVARAEGRTDPLKEPSGGVED